ncbi:hypothetical protein FACS1894105_01320 [Clostridia bacterium]|nr:hypothetical protein FACS1894105_01320 [Clostridia bacterium]
MVLAMVFSLGAFTVMPASAEALTGADAAQQDATKSLANQTGIQILPGSASAVAQAKITTVGFTYEANAVNPQTDTTKNPGTDGTFTAASSPAAAYGLYFDLVSEKLVNLKAGTGTVKFLPTIGGYSLDGGSTWKTGAPDDKAITSLLKKGGTLVLTDIADSKGKPKEGVVGVEKTDTEPAVTAVIGGSTWTLNAVVTPQNNGKAPKFAVNYLLGADLTGATSGKWVLTANKGATEGLAAEELAKLSIAYSTDGKTPIDLTSPATGADTRKDLWGYFPADGGIKVFETNAGSKPLKRTYLVRYAPYVEEGVAYPGTPAQKIGVVDQQAEPKVKIDLKKDQLKLKVGQTAFFGELLPSDATKAAVTATDSAVYTDATDGSKIKLTTAGANAYVATAPKATETLDKGVYITDDFAKDGEGAVTGVEVEDGAYAAVSGAGVLALVKGDKNPVSLKNVLTEEATYIFVWTVANEKKPASVKQVIKAPARQIAKDEAVPTATGKLRADKKWEFWDESKAKWGNAPKLNGEVSDIIVRLKATKELPASREGVFSAAWGIYNEGAKTEKEGVTSAKINSYNYNGKLVLTAPDPTTNGLVDGTNYIKNGGLYSTALATDAFKLLNVGLATPVDAFTSGTTGAIAPGVSIKWTLKADKLANTASGVAATLTTNNAAKPVIALNSTAKNSDGTYTLSAEVKLEDKNAPLAAANFLRYKAASTLNYSVKFTLDSTPPALDTTKGASNGSSGKLGYEIDKDGKVVTIYFTEEIKGTGADGAINLSADGSGVGDITWTAPAFASDVATAEISGKTLKLTLKTPIDLKEIHTSVNAFDIVLKNTITDLAGNALESAQDVEISGTGEYPKVTGTFTAGNLSLDGTKGDNSDDVGTFASGTATTLAAPGSYTPTIAQITFKTGTMKYKINGGVETLWTAGPIVLAMNDVMTFTLTYADQPADALSITNDAVVGSSTSGTSIVFAKITKGTAANSLAYAVGTQVTNVIKGSTVSGITALTADVASISATAAQYLTIYELDANSKVIAFVSVSLTGKINA